MEIFSAGFAHPHKFTVEFCCNTIPFDKTFGKRIWPCDDKTKNSEAINKHFFLNVLRNVEVKTGMKLAKYDKEVLKLIASSSLDHQASLLRFKFYNMV